MGEVGLEWWQTKNSMIHMSSKNTVYMLEIDPHVMLLYEVLG